MNFKQVNIGCIQKDILRSNYTASHYCWSEQEGTLLIYDGHKNLILYNIKKMKEEKRLNFSIISKQRHVANACFSKTHNVYFVLSDDWMMYVIRATEFECVAKFQSEIKYSLFLYFLEHKDAFISVTNEQCHYFTVSFKTNLKSAKYSSFVQFDCQLISHLQLQDPMSWNKIEEKKLLTWDINDVTIFNSEQSLQTIFKLKGIGSKDTNINCCIYLGRYDYLIAGYYGGAMKVWKIDQDGQNKKILMHTFEAHSRSVLSICKHQSEQKMIVSAGLDHTLKYWNVDTFQFLFSFRTVNLFSSITLLSSSFFISNQEEITSAGYATGSLKFLYTHDSEVVGIDKTYSLQDEKLLKRVQLVLKNNSGLSLDSQLLVDYNLSETFKQSISVLYPPPVSKKILSIISCPYVEDIFFIHIETGGFCKYQFKKTEENTLFFIETIINPNQFLDFQQKPFCQQITTMKFLDILPPKYDMDIGDAANFAELGKENTQISLEQYNEKIKDLQLVALGSEKGSIIFVSMNGQFDKIYTRFTFHRDEILELGVVKHKHNPTERYLLSFSREGFFKMVAFTQNSAELIKSITIGQNFDIMKCFQNKVILTMIQGDMKIFSLKNNKNLVIKQYENTNEHERRIVTIDIHQEKQLILTASKDNKIKIWNFKKIVLLQINLFEKLSGAAFINDQLDIVFSHSGRISLLAYKQIQRDVEVGVTNAKDYLENAVKGYASIEDYFLNNLTVNFSDNSKIASTSFLASANKFFSQRQNTKMDTSVQNSNSFYGNLTQNPAGKSTKTNKISFGKQQTLQLTQDNISYATFQSPPFQSKIQLQYQTSLKSPTHISQREENVQNSGQKYEDKSIIFNQQYSPDTQVNLNQLLQSNGNKKYNKSFILKNQSPTTNDNYLTTSHKHNPFLMPTTNTTNFESARQHRINSTSKKQRYNTEHYTITQSSEFEYLSSSFNQSEIQTSNHNLNMLNSPHYFYSSLANTPKGSFNSKLPDLQFRGRKQAVQGKKEEQKAVSVEMQKIYKALSPEQKYVCITALPKSEVKSYKYSLLEKYAIDRIAKRMASSRRENTLNKIIMKNLREPQEDFALSIQSSSTNNPLFGNLTATLYTQNKINHHKNKSTSFN